MTPEPKLAPAWLRFLTRLLVTSTLTCLLLAILGSAVAMDFGRWLLSGIWPIDRGHPERPGSRHPLS